MRRNVTGVSNFFKITSICWFYILPAWRRWSQIDLFYTFSHFNSISRASIKKSNFEPAGKIELEMLRVLQGDFFTRFFIQLKYARHLSHACIPSRIKREKKIIFLPTMLAVEVQNIFLILKEIDFLLRIINELKILFNVI